MVAEGVSVILVSTQYMRHIKKYIKIHILKCIEILYLVTISPYRDHASEKTSSDMDQKISVCLCCFLPT